MLRETKDVFSMLCLKFWRSAEVKRVEVHPDSLTAKTVEVTA